MSVPFSAAEAAEWTGGALERGPADTRFSGVSIDSRAVAAGQLFVAITGPNHDAHAYLESAIEAGAAGVMFTKGRALPRTPRTYAALAVEDTTRALGRLAAGHRAAFTGPVVAISGSNGKTTTKEMCAAILAQGAPTLRTEGNLNNHYGLPLTLLSRKPEHRRAVVELGMNHRGEIAELAAIARPTVGAVTNVGTAHIEYLGSRETIAAEKGDLLAALPADGVAVVNAEDEFAEALAARAPGRVLRFGRSEGADLRARDSVAETGAFAFRLIMPDDEIQVRVAGLGEPTVLNALCAAAAAFAAGAAPAEIAAGLAAYRPLSGRLEQRALPDGVVLIDDSYNANPQSMEVALRLLAASGGGRRIAVLGDMGELGEAADKAHRELGRLAANLAIDFLVAVGERAELVAEGALSAGMDREHIRTVGSSDAAGPTVRGLARSGDWVLLKGSRAMRMERVAQHFEAEARA